MSKVLDVTITSLDTITAWNLDGSFAFIMDELQDATIANAQETQEITGKGGRRLNSLKKNKSVTVSGTNGLISSGMLEAQTGGMFESKDDATVSWTEYATVGEGNTVVLTYKATGAAGSEIAEVRVKNDDNTIGAKLEQSSSVEAGKFTYTAGTKTLTFHTDVPAGTEIVVFYNRKLPADVLVNESDKYSKKLKLYIDATAEDKCGTEYRVQFYIPKADFSGEFELAMGDDQTVHAFEAESLAGACESGVGLWTYTVFGANAADA